MSTPYSATDTLNPCKLRFRKLAKWLRDKKISTYKPKKSKKNKGEAETADERPESQQTDLSEESLEEFIKQAEPPLLSENARKIYRAFDSGEMQTEELIIKTGLDVSTFYSAMTELELFDLVELQAGKNYKLKQDD